MYSKIRFAVLSLLLAGPVMVSAGCGSAATPGSGEPAGPDAGTGSDGSTGADGSTSVTAPGKVTPGQLGTWRLLGANTATATITSEQPWPSGTGTGSVRLFPGTGKGAGGDWPSWAGSGGKAFLGTTIANGRLLSDLTALSYQSYSVNAGAAAVMPYLNVFIDLDGDGVFDKTKDEILSFDASYFPATAQAAAKNDTWQSWDALSPTSRSWRCVFGHAKIDSAGTACTPNTAYGWNDLASYNVTAKIIPASCQEVPFPVASAQNTCATPDPTAPGVLFVAGQKSGDQFDQFTGYVDNVRLGILSVTQTYDFETQ